MRKSFTYTGIGLLVLIPIAALWLFLVQENTGTAGLLISPISGQPQAEGSTDLNVKISETSSVATSPARDQDESPAIRGPQFDKVIQVADGATINVAYRSAQPELSIEPSLELAGVATGKDMVERLKELANSGSAAAAYNLHLILDDCRNAPRTADDFQAALSDAYAGRYVGGISQEHVGSIPGPNTNQNEIVSKLEESYRNCLGILDEDIDSSRDFLQIAANTGLHPATLEFAARVQAEDPELSRQYLELAWESGSMSAAILLAEDLEKQATIDPDSRIASAAYLYAWEALCDGLYEDVQGPAIDIVRKRYREKIQEKLGRFSSYEKTKAIELATQLIAENEQCCVF